MNHLHTRMGGLWGWPSCPLFTTLLGLISPAAALIVLVGFVLANTAVMQPLLSRFSIPCPSHVDYALFVLLYFATYLLSTPSKSDIFLELFVAQQTKPAHKEIHFDRPSARRSYSRLLARCEQLEYPFCAEREH